MATDIETEIENALAEMEQARNDAAKPLAFTAQAAEDSDERSRGQFRASLPLIDGGFERVREGLLDASALYGRLAKELALFDNPNATEIAIDQAQTARLAAERACKLKVARKLSKAASEVRPSDGIPCA